MNLIAQENLPVRLKGVGDSLWVTLDPTLSYDLLIKELDKLFLRLGHLAQNARIVIDPGQENGHEPLIEKLSEHLKKTYMVGLVTLPPQKRSYDEERVRKRDIEKSWEHHKSEVLMLTGRVRSGQKVAAKKHLVIMGDVNPGAEIIAKGDILVMGSLRGMAAAGLPDNEEAIILALDFRPAQIQIGGYLAVGLPSDTNKTAEYAHVENGAIVVEEYMKVNPFSRLTWPLVR